VSEEDLHMTYLPGFKRCVQAGTYSFMCSYNSINGIPACANEKILNDVLRKDWKFKGYVVSDEGAIEYLVTAHKYVTTMVDAAAAAVRAGCNLELSYNLVQPAYLSIVDAVKQGKLNESLVRERVKPLFYTRMRLGQFDPPENNPYSKLNSSVVETPEHQAKAVEVAAKSFVLLKNVNNTLPLEQAKYKHVAVIGPMADEYDQIFGNLPPIQDRSFTKTPLQGLQELFKYLHFNRVCKAKTKCVSYNATLARETIKNKQLIIAVFGTGQLVEKEANDRHDTNLPGKQRELLQDIMDNKGSAKLILVLMNAGPLNVTFADDSSKVDAILECFFPGQATGEAIKKVLTNEGGMWSPAGRLPNTWYKYADQIPSMVNYSMQGRTYRYLRSDPLYPFGYGLSYSTFVYSSLKLESRAVQAMQNLSVTIAVQNTGLVDSDEVPWVWRVAVNNQTRRSESPPTFSPPSLQ
ncbi:beta-D-xylosidase 1, partial [Elysia marginata]